MSSSNPTTWRVPVFKPFVFFVSIVMPLTASALMGSRFLSELGLGMDSKVLLIGAGALLASSAVLGTLAGRCLRSGAPWIAGLCMLAWMMIVAFSTGTSSLSLLNTSGAVINKQVNYSQQGRAVQASIAANISTIAGLQKQIDAADPIRSRTKRENWAKQIADIQQQNMSFMRMQQSRATRGADSSVAGAFNKVGAVLGVSGDVARVAIILLFAICLDLLPFVAGTALGFLYGAKPAGKKPKASVTKLRAVA